MLARIMCQVLFLSEGLLKNYLQIPTKRAIWIQSNYLHYLTSSFSLSQQWDGPQ